MPIQAIGSTPSPLPTFRIDAAGSDAGKPVVKHGDKLLTVAIPEPGPIQEEIAARLEEIAAKSEAHKVRGDAIKNLMAAVAAVMKAMQLAHNQQLYDKNLNSEPKAPVLLDDSAAQAIRNFAQEQGYRTSFGSDDVAIVLDDQVYTFKPDGSVTKHEHGVPWSKEEQRQNLASLRYSIDEALSVTKGRSLEQLTTELDFFTAEYERVASEFASKYPDSGHLVDKSS